MTRYKVQDQRSRSQMHYYIAQQQASRMFFPIIKTILECVSGRQQQTNWLEKMTSRQFGSISNHQVRRPAKNHLILFYNIANEASQAYFHRKMFEFSRQKLISMFRKIEASIQFSRLTESMDLVFMQTLYYRWQYSNRMFNGEQDHKSFTTLFSDEIFLTDSRQYGQATV